MGRKAEFRYVWKPLSGLDPADFLNRSSIAFEWPSQQRWL